MVAAPISISGSRASGRLPPFGLKASCLRLIEDSRMNLGGIIDGGNDSSLAQVQARMPCLLLRELMTADLAAGSGF